MREFPRSSDRPVLSEYVKLTRDAPVEAADWAERATPETLRDSREGPTRMLETVANSGESRDAPDEIEPVDGTIAFTGANTGRLASPGRVNCGVRFRLRSTVLCPFTFQEKPPLRATIHFPGTRMPSMPRLLRHDSGARKPGRTRAPAAWRSRTSCRSCRRRTPSDLPSCSTSRARDRVADARQRDPRSRQSGGLHQFGDRVRVDDASIGAERTGDRRCPGSVLARCIETMDDTMSGDIDRDRVGRHDRRASTPRRPCPGPRRVG